ncbi:hypothetical protein SAMN02799631_06509 [Methylobacterium sp. 174MFSha1.1]|uniref:hypothetical protein n=1 Tax=Methylobacterium sp. 174MFSha1.1 TaxID=1502749 RepID=UPI0008E319EF|nr:hypothetical protein [Methylobacterium sp. 174MFSha1.1]SFV16756.1 hypothetical protein SAMN02799631_06509 [Methylobacterium sp. 174MFSha1.1]
MTDAAADRARWAAAFADSLAGFDPGPYVAGDEEAGMPLSPATRLTQSQENARKRAKRARDKARKVHELDAAIAQGLRSILRQRKVYERMKDGEELNNMAVRVEPVFAEAMRYLVEHCGWDRKLASRALTAKLLRPAQPPAAKA